MGAWSRGSVSKQLIEMSLNYYGDKPLPVDLLQEKNKKTPREMLEEIELRREELLKEHPGLAFFERLSIKTIIEETGAYYGFTYPEIISAQRRRELAFARHVAFYLCRKMPCGSFGAAPTLPEIGRRFGGRDHATVIHGIRKIQMKLDSGDKKLAADLDTLRVLIQARVAAR